MQDLFLSDIEGKSEISALAEIGVGLDEMEYLIQQKITDKLNSS